MRSKVTDIAEVHTLVLQQGGKSTHPDELTLVSDSGKCT